MKWPPFYRYVDLLPQTRFLVCVRHPFEVISSFKKQGGALRRGLDYPTAFNRRINASLRRETRRYSLRRVRLFDRVHEEVLALRDRPNVLFVRYERWFEDAERQRREIADFLQTEVGPGPAKLARPRGELSLTRAERELIAAECRTAASLGYDLSVGAAV